MARAVSVVVADDSARARRAIEEILGRSPGFELVGQAESGEEAVDLVRHVQPGLAIVDIRMPGIGGIEAARRIKSSWPETVVVLTSALPEEDVPTSARTCSAAVIHKPELCPARLATLWRTHLDAGAGGST